MKLSKNKNVDSLKRYIYNNSMKVNISCLYSNIPLNTSVEIDLGDYIE